LSNQTVLKTLEEAVIFIIPEISKINQSCHKSSDFAEVGSGGQRFLSFPELKSAFPELKGGSWGQTRFSAFLNFYDKFFFLAPK
jgi:hypothetical protein